MIIAEVGLNHLGSSELARKYVDFLCNTDVDGISFQVREKEFYLREEKKNLFLEDDTYIELCEQVKRSGKKFGVAIANTEKIQFFKNLDTDFYKIIRDDMKNDILAHSLIKTGKKVIVSTGLSSALEIKLFLKKHGNSSNIVINHTQLSYSVADCNLKAIQEMRKIFNVPVSFGSHCENHNVLMMSLFYEPSDILFYVKSNNLFKFPDDKHAVCLHKVTELASNLKKLPNSFGTGKKQKIGNKIREMKI